MRTATIRIETTIKLNDTVTVDQILNTARRMTLDTFKAGTRIKDPILTLYITATEETNKKEVFE